MIVDYTKIRPPQSMMKKSTLEKVQETQVCQIFYPKMSSSQVASIKNKKMMTIFSTLCDFHTELKKEAYHPTLIK